MNKLISEMEVYDQIRTKIITNVYDKMVKQTDITIDKHIWDEVNLKIFNLIKIQARNSILSQAIEGGF
jgi:hypothetical protein